jgi:hypothetical protein
MALRSDEPTEMGALSELGAELVAKVRSAS